MIDVMAQRPKWFIEQEGEGRASRGLEATQSEREKGNSSQEHYGSYKSWIENQVRLKAQLQEIQRVYI